MIDNRGAAPKSLTLSLSDLLGSEYTDAVCAARAFLDGKKVAENRALAREKVDFYPRKFANRIDELLSLVGTTVVAPLAKSARGAGDFCPCPPHSGHDSSPAVFCPDGASLVPTHRGGER